MQGKIQTKQSLVSSKVSSSHQILSYQTNTKSKLNEYINKLTLPYLNSFCQPSIFYSFILSLISFCFVVTKNFFNRYIKKLLKSRNDQLLIYRLLYYSGHQLSRTPTEQTKKVRDSKYSRLRKIQNSVIMYLLLY